MPTIKKNPNLDRVENFMTVSNAYALQLQQRGLSTEFLSATNAGETFKKIMRIAVAVAEPGHDKHKEAVVFIKNAFPSAPREALEKFVEYGERYSNKVKELAALYAKNNMSNESAVEGAFNSLAGNPNFDHWGNIAQLSTQLYEEQTFVNSFIDSGDAFNLPIEGGGDGSSMSRFRSPVEIVSGSAKTYQGDINPQSHLQIDSNRISISLESEFKNVKWLEADISLSSDQRDQILMYEKSIYPALAGFMIQQRLVDASTKGTMKLSELVFVGGLDSRNSYIPGVGGSYGILSSNIALALGDASAASPLPVSGAEWKANPTKIIQKIKNYYYKPTTVAAPLPLLDTALMYKEVTRLFNLPAVVNVDLECKEWILYVPTSWYSIAVQYPDDGTFNKQLQEMVSSATAGKIVKRITVLPSSLLNYGANIGTGTNAYNYMVLIAHGSPVEKKAVILPGQTTIPTVIALPSSSSLLQFQVRYATGGPMFKQYGGAFVLEFSNAA